MGSMHTISDGATLDISCTNFDSDGDMDDPLTIRGNGATLSVSGLVSWEMLGTLTTNPAQAGTAFLAGTAGISASGNFNANGNTTANARITFGPASLTTVAAGATLDLNAVPTFSGGEITGAGRLRIGGAPTVTANTTISAGSLDWDRDNTTHTHTINQGVTLTITSPVIENGGMRDALRVFGNNGTLTVSGPTSWDMRNTLTTNPTAVGTTYLNGTSDLVLTSATGIFNAAGNTTANASITFGPSSVTTVAAGATLDLYGAPTFSGGGITGAGTLRVGGSPVVTASTVISVATLDWDRDVFTHTHTINEGATLTITSPVIQGGGMRDSLTLRGNGSALTVSGPASWEMRGTLTTNLVALGTATVGGTSDLVLTSATGIFNARGNTTVATPITFGPSSATAVSAGATLTLNASATFAGPATVSGAGTLYIDKASTVTANTTIAVNTLNWDGGLVGSLHTINDGVALTINSPVLADEMSDDITLRGSGAVLAVNFSSPWEMRGTLTTNPANVGIATLAGSSRMVLNTATGLFNANGNTTVSAPITFGTGSITTVAAGARLTVSGDAIYNGGTITGAGDYWPPTGDHNTVTANSTISTTNFNFDSDDGLGAWTVAPGVRLTVNVVDYDGEVVNDFDSTLTLNSGNISANTADPVFVMEGTLNMNNTTGTIPYWSGDAIQIGDDAGTLDADINVGGTGISQIGTAIDFKSDADVDIAAGATLQLLGNASFNSVNGANNAEFTGGGRLQTNREVNFNEATTINMVGGALDLDGADGFGDTIFVKAPVIINVATMDSFGRVNGGGGTNTLDVNHSTATGTLAVNLDSPTAEWTLNAPGAMLLTNDPAAAAVTLLAGSAVNLNGLVNVTGDVRTTARVDIGGTVNILTAGKPLRLSGGDLTDTNTLVGGSINGPGLLGADSGSGLIGYGTINPDIDFDGSADLFADNGTLTVNGGILDARFFGTNDTDGILDVVHTWNSNTVTGVYLKGGELKGGTLFNDGAGGISGSGLVTARVINNSLINANNSAAPLILQATADYNDWDGYLAPETGRLQANAGTLELRSIGSFPFNSTVTAVNGGTVFANGFELLMRDGSTLNLTTGTFKQSNGITTNLYGTITVGAGTSQLLGAVTGGFRFNASCTTTLTGNLLLDCPTTFVAAGATFSGAGHLVNLSGKRLAPADAANLNVLVENAGTLAPGGTGVARNDFRDFIQGASGVLELNLNGTTLGAFDRLQINGSAQLTGTLQLSLGGGYVPALNDTITLLSTTGVVAGLFSPLVQPAGMPAGLAFEVNYLPNSVQLKVVSATPFDAWIKTFGIANPADRTKSANPDGDSLNNLGEFATDGNPTSGLSSGKIVGKIAPVGGVNAMTLTLPVRNGTVLDPADPAGGEFGLKQTADGLFYKIQASDGLGAWTLAVTEVNGPDATAIQLGLPALNPGWTYRTFRSPGPVAGDPVEFMRAVISD
jgi:autotransporter-associated beta strand protein